RPRAALHPGQSRRPVPLALPGGPAHAADEGRGRQAERADALDDRPHPLRRPLALLERAARPGPQQRGARRAEGGPGLSGDPPAAGAVGLVGQRDGAGPGHGRLGGGRQRRAGAAPAPDARTGQHDGTAEVHAAEPARDLPARHAQQGALRRRPPHRQRRLRAPGRRRRARSGPLRPGAADRRDRQPRAARRPAGARPGLHPLPDRPARSGRRRLPARHLPPRGCAEGLSARGCRRVDVVSQAIRDHYLRYRMRKDAGDMHDLIIKGGVIVDGTGAPAFRADVAVEGGRIVEVGEVSGPARRTIDAEGQTVTPGFVDIHTHYDGQASWDSVLAPSSIHGVTSVAMGNCGVGFAPARADKHDWLIRLLEGVEDIPGTALAEGLTWDWESFPDYLDALGRRRYTMDVAAHMPHAALRTYVMGERGADHT